MRLLFALGSHSDLAKKEIEAAATILPLPWNTSMLRPGLLELKTREAFAWEERGIAGYLSPEAVDLREQIGRLQARLGGTIQIIYLWQQSSLRDAPTVLASAVAAVPVGADRWRLAVRSYGSVDPERLALQIKRELKQGGRAMRYLPSRAGVAGVFHEKLDLNRFDPVHPGLELVVINEGKTLWLGATLAVQDIDEYSRRDFGIPVPDPVSGMLPPKLAQTMINLGLGEGSVHSVVYDPFCGNGRIVLEAQAMGFLSLGSDIAQEKVHASIKNLDWLMHDDPMRQPELRLWQGDATDPATIDRFESHLASQTPLYADELRNVVCEPYLGQPLRQPLQDDSAWLSELAELYIRFFTTWRQARIENFVVVFPAAKLAGGGEANLFDHLFDRLAAIGYSAERLGRYARPDAIVGRDLVKLTYAS